MKKILSLLLTICMISGVLTTIPITAFAATSGTCGDNLTWTLDDSGTLTISGTGAMDNWSSNVLMPWHSSRTDIKKVIISENVTSIGSNAFSTHTKLESVIIPNSVTHIGDDVFGHCYALANIEIPNSVTSIGDRTFYGCGLTQIEFPTSLTSIGDYAFGGCELTEIFIPESVSKIGECAFSGISTIHTIIVDDNNKHFSSSENTLFDKNKTKLILYAAASGYNNIYTVPDTVIEISEKAFCYSRCSEIIIPNGVKIIDYGAFYNSSKLKKVNIPTSVVDIKLSAFTYCFELEEITVDADNQFYLSDEGILFNKDKSILYVYPGNKTETMYKMPESVTTIYDDAFYSASNLSEVLLHNNVTKIGEGAFTYCTGLKNINIPDSVTIIGDNAFSYCRGLISVKLGNGVTTIGNSVFSMCMSLANVEISDGVNIIDCKAFFNCQALKDITIPRSVTSIEDAAFHMCSSLATVDFTGNEEEWKNIRISSNNTCLTNATINFLGNPKDDIGKFLKTTNKNGMSTDVSKFTIDATYPANKADDVPGTFDLRLYFNKSIESANASKKVKIIKDNGDVYKTLYADEGNISGNTVIFQNVSLPQGYAYSVVVDSGAYTSGFGDVFYGLQKGTFSFVVPPAADSHKVNLDYPGKYAFGLFGSNTDVPPIPKGSDSDYAEELQAWATAYGINSIAAYENPKKLLEIPVKNPVTDTRGQTFLLNDGGTTVQQVMDDLIFIESLKPYVAKMNVELKNIKLTDVSDNLVGYDDEKEVYNNKIVPYAEQISDYLDKRNENSSFFLSVATPLAYNTLLKSATSTLGGNESMFVKAIADASIDSIALEKELSTITGTKDYETFKSNLSDVKSIASAGKELYKIKTSGFSSSTAKLAIDLFDKYYTGKNETIKMLSDARSSMSDVISCTKMSAFLGTSLGFMPMVVELNKNLQKSLSDKIKAWFFIGDYYIKDKYPNIYAYYFTDGGYEINKDFISMEWESISSSSGVGAAAAREYQQCKNENDLIAVSWCDFADRTGVVKIRAAELLGVKRDLVNLGTIMKFVDTVDVEETKRYLLDYISATINKSKTSEFYGMCPIIVDVYDKNNNLLATLSSENEEDIESEYGSFYILGDDNETKYFIAASDEYRVEISAYDEGTMSVATVERDAFGNVVNANYFKDVSLQSDSRFSLISTPGSKSVLTNLDTEVNETESVNLPENIHLSCISNEIAIGKTLEIIADVFPDFSQYDSVEWQVFDESNNATSSATIENGMFVASEEGKYIIKASIGENMYDKIVIDAYQPITQIFCGYETLTMMTGEEKEIELTTNADASSERVIKMTSSNQTVAVVNDDGTITATGQGEATIKYTADDVELLLPVIVYDAPVEISLYQSDTDGMRFKIDAMNTSCQNSFVGTATVNVLKDNEILETDTIDLKLKLGQVYSGFVDFDYLTASNNCYDVETTVYDKNENLVFKSIDITDGVDYVVTLNDGDTTIKMSYAEFNEYIPTPKEGHTFVGWYKEASYESSSKVEKLTTAYGREITLYGLWVSNEELVKANVSKTYSDDELIVDVTFENLYVGGSAVVVIFESENDITPIMSVSKEFSINDSGLNFNIPFIGDDKEYILKVSFYDNLTDKNEQSEVYTSAFTAERTEYISNGFSYMISDDETAMITGCRISPDKFKIPVELDGYIVTKIADAAFMDSEFESVLIPDTISVIESNAFTGCENLKDVYYIGTEEQWEQISIDNGNETLIQAEKTYNYCNGIVNIDSYNCGYEDGNLLIDIAFNYVYKDCFAYIDVFDAETKDKKVGFTQTIEKITSFKEMSFPFTADDNEYIVRVSIVNSETDSRKLCEAVEGYMYAAKQRYTVDDFDFVLNEEGEAEIESYFGNETDLIIPETLGEYSVTGLYEWGLSGADISTVYIGEHITKIGDGALSYCYNLNNITVAENNPNYCSVDGMLYSKDKTIFMQYLISKEDGSFEIPEGVKVIGAHAFEATENIKTIKLPQTLERIEWQGLACSIEGDLILPESVKYIGKEAFANSKISSITVPSGTTEISVAAFSMMPNLSAINVDENNAGYVSENGVLFKTDDTSLVKRKIGLMAYPVAKSEKSYAVPDGVYSIYPSAFGENELVSVILPSSLRIIGEQAFVDSTNLKTVCYKGNENQYSLLQIQNYNDWLIMADVVFNYDGNPNIISDAYAEFCNETIFANVEFSLLTQDGTLFVAIYDKDGRLISLDKKEVTPDEFYYDFEFEMECFSNDYTVKVFCWESGNTLKPLSTPFITNIQEVIITDAVLESEHPYTDDCNDTQVFEYDGECTSLSIRFTEDCELEEGFDYVYIYDANDESQCFTGTELANKTVVVNGNIVKIQLVADGSVSGYGYKTKRIVAIK